MSHSHSVRSASLPHLLSSVSFIPLLAAGMSAPADAQTALELPGIVVEGATLEAPRSTPKKKPAAAAASAPTAAAEGQGQEPAEGVAEAEAASDQAAGVPAAHLGTAVTVVTGEDLQRQQIRHAADALRSLPGVSVSRSGGGLSSKTQVRIRGAEGNHTLVLIDGIEVNDPNDGEFDFGNLLADDIEKIEVIRGPYSGIYGSGAIGGVINIITKRGEGPPKATVSSEIGAYGTRQLSARISGGTDHIWGSLTAQKRDTSGFNISQQGDEEDRSSLLNLGFNAGVKILETLSVELVARKSDNRFDRDGFDAFTVGDLAKAFDDESTVDTQTSQVGIKARWDAFDGNLTHILSASRSHFESVDDDATNLFVSANESEAVKMGYLTTYRFSDPVWAAIKHTVSGLVQMEQEAFIPKSSFADGIERRRERLAVAGEHRVEIGNQLFIDTAVRHDDNDVFEDFTTWRTAATFDVPKYGLRPHASIGTGVRLPTMFEQFGSIPAFFTPNENLLPERSFGWDAGIEVSLWQGRAIFDVTYFNTELTDKIDGLAPGPDGTLTAENLPGRSHREGLELTSRVQLSKALSLGIAYTYLDAKNPTGERELRRPSHSGRVDVSYDFDDGRGNFTLATIYIGENDDRTFRLVGFHPEEGWPLTEFQRVTLDDFWLVTAAASYKLQPGVEFFGRAENLLDTDYEEIFGYNTPGIAAYAGVRFTLGATSPVD